MLYTAWLFRYNHIHEQIKAAKNYDSDDEMLFRNFYEGNIIIRRFLTEPDRLGMRCTNGTTKSELWVYLGMAGAHRGWRSQILQPRNESQAL